jgi:putative transposase
LKDRGLKGVELFVSDKCLGPVENLADFYPEAKWQRCVMHFYRVWTAVPTGKVKEVAAGYRYFKSPQIRRLKIPQAMAERRHSDLRGSGCCDWRISWRYRSCITMV